MDCKRVETELVPFQLAVLDGATRAHVETHLVGCGRCVGQFLAVKRAIDAGDDVGEGPSDLARARILRSAGKRLPQLAAPVAQAAMATAHPREPKAKLSSLSMAEPPTSVRRRVSRVILAMSALGLAVLAPFFWRATHATTAPAQLDRALPSTPQTPFLPTEPVDTARMTPDNLRFL